MWHSEADIFKDLMSLDDCGKDETYKVLYSRGRGFKNHQKPESANSFVDSRTGETVNLDEILEPSEIFHKSRGRGNALSSFLRSGNQLEKQLRLARPLGSGDNVIEAFCRRNFPTKNEESTSESEPDAGQPRTSSNVINSPFCFLIDNVKQRVKATRNSKLQQNALINSLTSKGTCESDWSSAGIKPNLGSGDGVDDDDDGDDGDDDDDDDDDDDVDDDADAGGGGGGGSKGDGSITNLSRSFDFDYSSSKSRETNIPTKNSFVAAIKDTLENDGTLGKFKAEMRTKIMDILNSQLTTEKPKLSNETLLINELIREYFTWNGYKYAKSVFIQECGLSSEPLTRNQLLEDLGVCDTEDSSKFSVLHGMITAFKEYVKKGT